MKTEAEWFGDMRQKQSTNGQPLYCRGRLPGGKLILFLLTYHHSCPCVQLYDRPVRASRSGAVFYLSLSLHSTWRVWLTPGAEVVFVK